MPTGPQSPRYKMQYCREGSEAAVGWETKMDSVSDKKEGKKMSFDQEGNSTVDFVDA